MSDDLAAFLAARLDEDERIAKRAAKKRRAPWRISGRRRVISAAGNPDVAVADTDGLDGEIADHIALHDPARALRDVEAKRAILGMHHPTEPHPEGGFTYPDAAKFCGWCGPGDDWQAEHEPDMFSFALWPCRHARLLAAVYSDHPDYDPDWKP